MVQKLIITNFYSVREKVEISFEASKEKQYNEDWVVSVGNCRLLKAILFYGANGSGKTNILCAFHLLRSIILNIPKEFDEPIQTMPFALDPTFNNRSTKFELYFFIEETRYRYFVELTTSRIIQEELWRYSSGKKHQTIFSRKYNEEKGVHKVRFGAGLLLSVEDRKEIEKSTINTISVLSAYASKNISCAELSVVRDYFKYRFFQIYTVEDRDQEVAKALQEDMNLKLLLMDLIRTFHSNIVDIKVSEEIKQIPEEARQILLQMRTTPEERKEIENLHTFKKYKSLYIHKTELGEFPLEDSLQSDGTRNFVRHLVLFYNAIRNNSLVILDEFGTGLQARTQHLLLDFFLKFSKHSQLLFATQSLGLLDFPIMRRDAIMIVSKNTIGQTSIDSNTVKKIHKNIRLRKAYADGRFTTIDPNEPNINLNEHYDKYLSLIYQSRKEECE